jgi:hypothetical protein
MALQVQAEWSLNASADSVLQVARGVMRAATSDNVQPLAILACEQFGNTIAMSPETCRKIEKVVLPSPPSAPVQFLRAAVGYSANDTATQLGRSLAGVQFLAIAAPLVTTLGPFEGGKALEVMLRQSAADKTLLPTVRQLKELLACLEPRCHLSGFADSVVGWHCLICDSAETKEADQWKYLKEVVFAPTADALAKVVDAFRQLSRIGEASVVKVTIRSMALSAWLAAFTKWCLGVPPSVYLSDGTPVIEQTGSMVDIIAFMSSNDGSKSFEVTIHHSLGNLVDLAVEGQSGTGWTGMVSIGSYGKLLLQEYGMNSGLAKQAVHQALPFAISQVLSTLRFSKNLPFDMTISELHEWRRRYADIIAPPPYDSRFSSLALSPFPGEAVARRIIASLLNVKQDDLPFLDLGAGPRDPIRVADLSVVMMHTNTLREECTCIKCDPMSSGPKFKSCKADMFFHHLAFLVADTLALSLFLFPESLLVQVPHPRSQVQGFRKVIHTVLFDAQHETFPVQHSSFWEDLLDWTLDMVGHDTTDVPKGSWVLSSRKGQVIYPQIFETFQVEKVGYMSLCWLQGQLRYYGQEYPRAVTTLSTNGGADPITHSTSPAPVLSPRNLLPNHKVVWRVEVKDGFLAVCMSIDASDGTRSHMTCSPRSIWENLAGALILESCEHDSDKPLSAADDFCRFTGPFSPMFRKESGGYGLGVVAVDGADDLRLLALAAVEDRMPCVIRKGACLQCCIDICKTLIYPMLIL